MSARVATRTKQRIFVAVLALCVVWPLVHFALARTYRINHWRFAGFGMYTRPAYQPRLVFQGFVRGEPLTPAMLKAALGKETSRIDDFVKERRMWGAFVRPDALGRLILARVPGLGAIDIVIVTFGLEPLADRFSARTERYRCTRTRPCQRLR